MSLPKYDPESLKALKTKGNFSNQAISDLSGVPSSTVNRILRGDSEPGVNTLAAMVYSMGGSLDQVCGFPAKPDASSSADGYKVAIAHLEKTNRRQGHWLIAVSLAFLAAVSVFVGIVIYDLTHLDRGWFQDDPVQQVQQDTSPDGELEE
ncbi:MAG: helix-turn-helix transcriptional regulator [Ruminiclostridium sp.]|nr:helix-turn-helix transcriptional regulator [Ruminiclostridium sp.]